MRILFPVSLCFLLLLSFNGYAQMPGDTMHVGTASYRHFHPNQPAKALTARIVNDSVLVVYDSTGMVQDMHIRSWVLAITLDSAYTDFAVQGNVVSKKYRDMIASQPPGGWICIERVVAEDSMGHAVTFNGEKWVKL